MNPFENLSCEEYYREFPDAWELAYNLFFENMELKKNAEDSDSKERNRGPQGTLEDS